MAKYNQNCVRLCGPKAVEGFQKKNKNNLNRNIKTEKLKLK